MSEGACTHDPAQFITADEGTSYCPACEREGAKSPLDTYAGVGSWTPAAFPARVVVGANGAYWRDFGGSYSMCPVSDDNAPVEVAAVYERVQVPTESLYDEVRQCGLGPHRGHAWFVYGRRVWCNGREA
jgi:hypothetical protein